MGVTLMTTTGTLEDVQKALGTPPSTTAEPDPFGRAIGTAETYPPPKPEAPAEPPETPAAEPDATHAPETPAAPDAPETPAEAPPKGDIPDSEYDDDGEPLTERAARNPRTKLRTIHQLRNRARTAETEKARLEGELAATRAQLQSLYTGTPQPVPDAHAIPPATTDEGEPKESDYDTYDGWVTARAAHAAREAYREERQRADAEAADRQMRQIAIDRAQKFAVDHPDFKDVIQASDVAHVPLTPALHRALNTSDDGPAIAYALAKDPARFRRLIALPEADAIYELGRLSAEVSRPATPAAPVTPVPPKVTSAPPPPTPVRGASVSASMSLEDLAKTIPPGDTRTSEWIRRRNEQIAKRGR